jgi:hypothetical protein
LRSLRWAPRILCLGFAGFVSIFALDAGTPSAFLLHLLPALLVLFLLALAWRRELAGAVAFPLLGILYILWAWGRFPFVVYLVVAGPTFLVGGLFLASWVVRRRA